MCTYNCIALKMIMKLALLCAAMFFAAVPLQVKRGSLKVK